MRFDAVVFDLGNTLLPWGEAEAKALYTALRDAFEASCGPMPDFFERAFRARDALIREREETTLREVTAREFADAVSGSVASAVLVDAVIETTHHSFLETCVIPQGIPELIERLGRSRPLAVLSNFFLTEPVEAVLKRDGLWEHFVHVEVSATQGYMKPHPAPFETVREKLGTPHERTLMVGDDFWADIVGGHRAGLLTALTHQYRKGPTSDPRAPGVRADRTLQSLHELEDES
ncbi:MAG: HAD family hydrolase [Planctomycetota bacterium]|jgi:FMN phosphatase YigB (HAD superfamily)